MSIDPKKCQQCNEDHIHWLDIRGREHCMGCDKPKSKIFIDPAWAEEYQASQRKNKCQVRRESEDTGAPLLDGEGYAPGDGDFAPGGCREGELFGSRRRRGTIGLVDWDESWDIFFAWCKEEQERMDGRAKT